MNCCRCECAYLSVIIGIIAGVIIGALYALGFVATGIIFWALLAIGVAGIFLTPIYAASNVYQGGERCFCNYRKVLLTASVGTVVTAAAGLIVAGLTSTIATAMLLGLATFFAVMLLVVVICLSRCMCAD